MGGLFELAASALPAAGLVGPAAMLSGWWAHKRASRKQTDDASLAVVKELRLLVDSQAEQLKSLNKAMEDERRVCEARIDRIEETRRADNADARRREEGLSHKLKNVEASFDSMLLAIEIAPDKAAEVVTRIKDRRRPELTA